MKPLLFLALLGCLASVFVARTIRGVKWCVTSDAEFRKCMDLASHSPVFSCVKRERTHDCMVGIRAGEADAITLNGGDIYTAGLRNTDLVPIIAEEYAPPRVATRKIVHQKRPYYSVAVVKKTSKFHIRHLQGKRSCHTGLGDHEGWITPMATLESLGLFRWPEVDNKPLTQVVSEFFFSSCVPGVRSSRNLCNLCKGDCTKSDREPFYGNSGAFKCLEEDGGEVAFVRHDAVPESEKARYELLCPDNSRAPINSYEFCNLGKAGEDDVITIEDNDSSSCQYAVAVVKKGTTFGINDLRGKRSCHTGLGDFEGWYLPIGTLLAKDQLRWSGIEDAPLEEAVSEFFQSSCIPGTRGNLCRLCKGHCSKSEREPYYGDAGAFRCLAENAGEVAFIKHGTVPDSEKFHYELLCKDNTRAPLGSHKSCNLGRVPAHAVVSRNDPELAEFIWTSLNAVQGFNLFSSASYAPAKNLMFSDSTVRLLRVPPNTDSFLYLGAEHMSIIRSLGRVQIPTAVSSAIRWCAVGHHELSKCDMWTIYSISSDGEPVIGCQSASTVEECIEKILHNEADAMAMDGGQVYTAGICGLVPVMVEQYDEAMCGTSDVSSSYYAVAVVKKGSGVIWGNLQGKRSCHGAIGSSAGWNIPMVVIHKMTNDCDFTKFFSEGCAPGADPNSPFCIQCIGNGRTTGNDAKCKANSEEQYHGNTGAFRCLVEGSGDVAFIKHTTVLENTDGNGPYWARDLRSAHYELICPGKDPVPITDFASCHLAQVPGHAVMTRPSPESRSKVVRFLQEQQAMFGPSGSDPTFRMFLSEAGRNLLFTDSTKCLKEVQVNYESFLGNEYMTAMRSLRQCSADTPDLENSCTFHTCR